MTKSNASFIGWWIKKDLRIEDNLALTLAIESAFKQNIPCYAFWIDEPKALVAKEYHCRRDLFLLECLEDLKIKLERLGIPIFIVEGDALESFHALMDMGLKELYSHEETGLLWTYKRDLSILSLLKQKNIPWNESPTNGVVRRLESRDKWSSIYKKRMSTDPLPTPSLKIPYIKPEYLSLTHVNFCDSLDDSLLFQRCQLIQISQQKGGETEASKRLDEYLHYGLYSHYLKSISKPTEGAIFGSRLSPYFAFGCLSSRQVINTLNKLPTSRSLTALKSRISWKCHFIQKLENFPDLEDKEQNSALEKLRPPMNDEEWRAWREGKTGYPLIDACLRSVHTTGFLNFRMRAMLMSFSTHLLLKDWRMPAWDLAQSFLDFEPGIHFAQVQMQAAVTGINTIRIYSPLKQSLEQDPEGTFIKKWLPELRNVSCESLHSLEGLPSDYAKPIVPFLESYQKAKAFLWSSVKSPEAKEQSKVVYKALGSRKRPRQKAQTKKEAPSSKKVTIFEA
jgi:deoxyribodipyrimidine photo-lyase